MQPQPTHSVFSALFIHCLCINFIYLFYFPLEFKILGRGDAKDLLLVVGVNRGLSSEERDLLPPEVNGIRIVTEYSEALPQLPPEVQRALAAANEESSSSSDEEGNNDNNNSNNADNENDVVM